MQKIQTKELIQAIEKVLPASDTKSIVSQTDHLIFSDGLISTYNGKISISTPVDLDLEFSVPAQDLFKVLKSVSSKEVKMDVENGVLFVTSDDLRASISTELEEDAALQAIRKFDMDDLYDGKAKSLPYDFIESLEMCIPSASKNADDASNLNCISIKDGMMISGDGYRCSSITLGDDMDDVLIPLSSAVELVKFYPSEYIISGGWMHLADEFDTIFSLRIVNGDFPNILQVIESFEGGTSVTLPDSLKQIVQDMGSISESSIDLFRVVEISIMDKTLECVVDKNGLSVTKTIELDEESGEASFIISSPMLANILNTTNQLEINDKFAMFSHEEFVHLIALVA